MARPFSAALQIGGTYHYLTVLSLPVVFKIKGVNIQHVLVKCKCGKEFYHSMTNIKSGIKKSCGCYVGDLLRIRNTKTGLSRTKEYRVWVGMNDRCYDNKYSLFHRYGGRGIKVCDRWRYSLENFIEDMGLCPKDCSIDRINNDGDYEPNNCRWATVTQQCNNRSTNLLYTIDGREQTLKQWCNEYGMNYSLVWNRIKRCKMDAITALNKPVTDNGQFKNNHNNSYCKYVINTETKEVYKSIKLAAKAINMPYTTLIAQLKGDYSNKTKLSFYDPNSSNL